MNRALFAGLLFTPLVLIAQDTGTAVDKKPTVAELRQTAEATYEKKDYRTCAELYARTGRDTKDTSMLYNAACCLALAGKKDEALAMLTEVLGGGWHDTKALQDDPDLALLHGDARWAAALVRSESNWTQKYGDTNRELWNIMEADQADRESGLPNTPEIIARDRARLRRVREMTATDKLKTLADYLNAALIFQHGEVPADYQQAHELALRAASIDPSNGRARWLAAASQDRFLLKSGKPQIYGTQFLLVDGVWILDRIDESAVTDEERAKWNVPPLADAKKRAVEMNKKK